MILSPQQLAYFRTFGFLVVRQMFSPTEIAAFSHGFDQTMAACAPTHPSTHPHIILGPIHHRADMHAVLDHPAVVAVAGGILGEDFNYACGDGSLSAGEASVWHCEGDWGCLFACKLCVYLDPMTRDRGALRVIPWSHEPSHPVRRQWRELGRLPEEYGIGMVDLPGTTVLETLPGDVIIFNHDLYHAAFGHAEPARMFSLNLTKHCVSDEDLQRLRCYLVMHSPGGHRLPIGGMYFNPILESAGPERLRHLEQCRAIHDQLFPELACRMTHGQQIEAMMQRFHGSAPLRA